jgi:16S rRNA (cytosine1402-N4)-methyltransferase
MRFSAEDHSFEPVQIRRHNFTLEELKALRGKNLTAYDLVNFLSQDALANMLFEHGERNSRKIARYIVNNREKKRIYTTFDLVQAAFRGPRQGKRHPATLTFQALRMVVNREIEALEAALTEGWEQLAPGGRYAVLSYHSMEDRCVKQFFKSTKGILRTKKPLEPTYEEVKNNPRSRSAKLRVCEKQK